MFGSDFLQQPEIKQILDVASGLGYSLLRSGAEISRVEDTVLRICEAYNVRQAHVFAISSSLIITLEHNGETFTQTRRIRSISTNLYRVDKLNELSRFICENKPAYSEIMQKIQNIEESTLYPPVLSVAAYALVSGAFALFFGGALPEACVAFGIGAAVRLVMLLAGSLKTSPFFTTASASAAAAFSTVWLGGLLPGLQTDVILLGVLMNLVPGVALTNSIRDFIATDYMSGMARMAEAFFTATAIALGVAVMFLW